MNTDQSKENAPGVPLFRGVRPFASTRIARLTAVIGLSAAVSLSAQTSSSSSTAAKASDDKTEEEPALQHGLDELGRPDGLVHPRCRDGQPPRSG
jgi:hypothetical protein